MVGGGYSSRRFGWDAGRLTLRLRGQGRERGKGNTMRVWEREAKS